MVVDHGAVESSILVLTLNEAEKVRECLSAVCSQQSNRRFEVIVVDSGSSDATLAVAGEFPVRIEHIPLGTFHHSRTRNYAASLARGEYLVYLSQDARPASDLWLKNLLGPFDDPRVAAVYGRHLAKEPATSERRQTLASIYGERRIIKDKSKKRELGHRCYHFSTVNAAIRKRAWQSTNFPDVKVFEDVAISKELIEAGWKIAYEPGAAVFHSHNHSPGFLFKRYFDLGVTWRRLGMWDPDVRASLLRDGWQLMAGQTNGSHLHNGNGNGSGNGNGHHPNGHQNGNGAQYSSLHLAAAKATGMALGLNERFLPLKLKQKFSAYKLFD